MRTYVPLVEEKEEVGIFHIAAEVPYGYSPGLQTGKSSVSGDIISNEAGVEAEVQSFYQGSQTTTTDASDPAHSGFPSTLIQSLFPSSLMACSTSPL